MLYVSVLCYMEKLFIPFAHTSSYGLVSTYIAHSRSKRYVRFGRNDWILP